MHGQQNIKFVIITSSFFGRTNIPGDKNQEILVATGSMKAKHSPERQITMP
jgi:hypothetical protein